MNRRSKHFLNTLLIAVVILVCVQSSRAQDCVNVDDIKKMQAQLKSPPDVTFNKKLHDELLKLRKKDHERVQDAIADRKPDNILDRLRDSRSQNSDSLCVILKQYGWPTKKLVGDDGADAV